MTNKKKDRFSGLEPIRNFLLYSTLYGIPINFSLTFIFGLPFTCFSWFGYGIFFWFLEFKITKIIRSVFFK